MNNYRFLVPVLPLFFLASSCGWLTNPEDNKVNPRKFTWSVDTLAYPDCFQIHISRLWGSSTKDVYAVGFTSCGLGIMWHFDGKEWTDVPLSVTQGGNITGAIYLADIHGFSADDIWAVGEHIQHNPNPPPNFLDSTLIIHYDGSEWREVETPPGRGLMTISGSSPNDLWTGGKYGTLFHYDGSSWTPDSIPLPMAYDSSRLTYFNAFGGFSSDQMYAIFWEPLFNGFLLSYNGDQWTVIDSFYYETHKKLWTTPSGRLYSVGAGGVNSWEGGTSQTLLEGDFTFLGLSGTNDENLFAVGYRWSDGQGVIYHYNGEDWYRYPKPEGLPQLLTDVWTDGTEVFVVGYTTGEYPQASIILHGS